MTDTVIKRENSTATVCPPGDIVAGTAPELRAALRDLIGDGVRDLVLDLSAVQMVDSTGLGLLISTHNSLRKIGGQFSVVGASEEILHFFQAMRLPQHFSVAGRSAA